MRGEKLKYSGKNLYHCHFVRHAVVQFVEAPHYESEGRGFDSRRCHWNFSLMLSFWSRFGLGVDSAPNRNDYQEYFLGAKGDRCVGLTTLPLSCADCPEIWEPQRPGTLGACPGVQWDCFTFIVAFSASVTWTDLGLKLGFHGLRLVINHLVHVMLI